MKLIAYLIDDRKFDIRPAPVEREWMDATDQRSAYRCLPLNIANAHGWEIGCPKGFYASWNGGKELDAVSIRADPGSADPPLSHFGYGIITFHIHCLFRTDPGYDLMVMGPVNRPKDSIAPLSGVVETDWAPFTFTMNWKFTRPGTEIRFEKGEAFCHLLPFRRGELEEVQPELRKLSDAPEIRQQYDTWQASRKNFLTDLKQPGSPAQEEGWQKSYYQGRDAKGQSAGADGHRTRLRLKPFAEG